jgi:hypothetical protein
VNAQGSANANQAQGPIFSNLNSYGIDGTTIISMGVTSQGISPTSSSTSSSATNLPLVLGISIGVGCFGNY